MDRHDETWMWMRRPGRVDGSARRAHSLRRDWDSESEPLPRAGALSVDPGGLDTRSLGFTLSTLSAAAGKTPWSKPARTPRMSDAGPAGNLVDRVGPSLTPRPAALGAFLPQSRRVAERPEARSTSFCGSQYLCASAVMIFHQNRPPAGLVGAEIRPPRGACLRSAPIDSLKRPTSEPPPAGGRDLGTRNVKAGTWNQERGTRKASPNSQFPAPGSRLPVPALSGVAA